MNTATIEELAYLIKQAKDQALPQPIVFLGAGASKSGGVPLAGEIVADILEKYKENPSIKNLKDKEKTYTKLMECLTPYERNELLKGYINEAKINVTHIYLAQLIIEGFVDYVLTVNFDNLMLRALALFNNFPATYDMAILKDLTTTKFKVKSVVYLHGQHHGLWLLNTPEEMAKVREIIPPILDSIKDQRPWIFIGYSGEDPIFDHILKLGRFDNRLFWVAYQDHVPNKGVCEGLLNKANTNASLIKGYDSDSFLLRLNSELGLPQPQIIDKPFTSLKNSLDNIVDIDDDDKFKGVKERLDIVKKDVNAAIRRFELGEVDDSKENKLDVDIGLLKKQIIDCLIEEKFDAKEIEKLVLAAKNINDSETNDLLAELFTSWGDHISDKADLNKDENLFKESFEKYKCSYELNPHGDRNFYNWGSSLDDLARTKGNDEELLYEVFDKYKRATDINPHHESAFYNWGLALAALARAKGNDEDLLREAFDKYKRATEINLDKYEAFDSWGTALAEMAETKGSDEELLREAFDKFKRATEIEHPDKDKAFYNWGLALHILARAKGNDEELLREACDKYKRATEINSDKYEVFYGWGTALVELAEAKDNDDELFHEAFDKYKRAVEIKPDYHEAFYNWGIALDDLAKAKGNDEELFREAFDKYKQATELKPDRPAAYYVWGSSILTQAKPKNDEALYKLAIEKLQLARDLAGKSYNLACTFALMKKKQDALEILEDCFIRKEVEPNFVLTDPDWQTLLDDEDFKALLDKYKD